MYRRAISILLFAVACRSQSPAPLETATPAAAADLQPIAEAEASMEPAPQPVPELSLAQRLDAVATRSFESNLHTGMAVVVMQHGEIVFNGNYGHAILASHAPVTAETVFRIGSVTKSFTAAAVLKLEEQGKLRLDDPVRKYVPQLNTHKKKITLRHLLTHTSGIANYTEVPEIVSKLGKPFSRKEMVKKLDALPLDFEPGSKYKYSNSGYYLLGLVIEKAARKSYEDAVREMLLEPAALTHTGYCPQEMNRVGDALGYTVSALGIAKAESIDISHPYAAGALCSSAPDLARWMNSLMTQQIVTPAQWQAMSTNATPADGPPYAMGLISDDFYGHRRVHHDGQIPGFAANMLSFPDDSVVIVVLANFDRSFIQEVSQGLAEEIFVDSMPKRQPLTAAQSTVYVGDYDFPEVKVKLRVRYAEGGLQAANIDEQGNALTWIDLKYLGEHKFSAAVVGANFEFRVQGNVSPTVDLMQGGQLMHGQLLVQAQQ